MNSTEKKLIKMKKEFDKLEKESQRLKGSLDQILSNLKEILKVSEDQIISENDLVSFGQDKIKELSEKRQKSEKQLEGLMLTIEEEYHQMNQDTDDES